MMIQTPRLNLILLSAEQLATGLRSVEDLAHQLGIYLVPDLFSGKVQRAVQMKLSKMEGQPLDELPWVTYWLIVIREDGMGVGTVGFKGVPDGQGEVEIGYGIDPLYQGKGFMTEAVKAMVAWAFSKPECLTVTAVLSAPDNFASHRVLEKSGFTRFYSGHDGVSYRLERKNWTPHDGKFTL